MNPFDNSNFLHQVSAREQSKWMQSISWQKPNWIRLVRRSWREIVIRGQIIPICGVVYVCIISLIEKSMKIKTMNYFISL